MKAPNKIKIKGEIYLSESIAPTTKGEKVEYKGTTYIKEQPPAEFVMFEGVAYRRVARVEEYNKKVMQESRSAVTSAPKKIRLKGTDIVLEAKSTPKKDK